ncbi:MULTISPECIES: ABC transporter permease [unclassified Pseudactinotalea]|uniref:ABC transporter permease n=1 Tax=Micrococcales TaxID=85006 RepID=UPI003C7CFAD2
MTTGIPTSQHPGGADPGGPEHPFGPAPVEPAEQRARAVSWQGVRTVLVLELRQRVRSTRWKVALVAFFVLVGVVSILLHQALTTVGGAPGSRFVYELILMFVLGLGLLVTPTLSSTAINGDRQAGTLAIMQITKLSPVDLALGKLLAGWFAALSFLAVSMPFLIWSWVLSRTGIGRLALALVVLALLLVVVCAVSLGFSALTNRPAGSTVLSYLTVGTLSILCLVLFGLTFPLITQEREVQVYTVPFAQAEDARCRWETHLQSVSDTDRTWWLLAVNPFVILADSAAPSIDPADRHSSEGPLGAIRGAVQLAREGPSAQVDQCWSGNYGPDAPEPPALSQTPHWPWGLGLHLLLGAGGLTLAIRRLAVPYRTLSRGARVA